METLGYDQDGPVGWLRLNRPDRHNAMTTQLWAELAELGRSLRDDPSVRALVVVGNGRSFSSGIDLASFAEGSPLFAAAGSGGTGGEPGDPLPGQIAAVQAAYTWLAEAPFPTIAAVRGHALGAGCQLALACDLRVVARGATFGLPEHRYGLIPDLGGTYWLTQLVGPAKAKELIWTVGTLDAEAADRLGLVNRLVDDADLERVAGELAARVAAAPPIAVRHAKRMVDDAARGLPLAEAMERVAAAQSECIRSKDFVEAISAFTARRPPEYQGH